MTYAAIVILVTGFLIVWVGSRHNLFMAVFIAIISSVAVVMATAEVADYLRIERYAWHGPVLATIALVCMGACLTYAWAEWDQPFTWAHINAVFTHVRRRSSVRADVRRAVKQYNIEVEK